jgi:uncharacterized repeat protein (TIGR01451 family)
VLYLGYQISSAASRWIHVFVGAILALFLLSALSAPAQAQTVNRYTNSTDSSAGEISGTVPCTVGITFQRDFNVTDDFSVQDVNLGVMMAHTNRSDYGLYLRSPAGNIVTVKNNTVGGSADHFNVLLDDQAASNISTHTANDTATAGTVVPPYQRTFRPSASMNGTFVGQSSYGAWSLFICDFANNGVNGTFFQADLYLTTPPPSADLSLSKSVASSSPTTAVYTLSVTNSSGSVQTASGVTVQDILPSGVTYVSSSGTGTYNNGTGIWTIGTNLAPGATVSIDIAVNITAVSGTNIVNNAQIMTSSQTDPDSTPGNGVTTEDDYASRSFTVGGRMPGVPPSIGGICSAAGTTTTVLDWNSNSWTSGSTTGSANVSGLGTVNFSVATQGSYLSPLVLSVDNNGGLGSAGLSLFQNIEYTNINQVTTTTVTLPNAVSGAQFKVFDVDYAVNDFADKLTVTGSLNGGAAFNATLTNGASNYISGNSAIGDLGAAGTSADGNVVATFSAPVDTIYIIYGNHSTAPADPDGQAISIHDFTFCRPIVDLNVTKTSSVVTDNISANNPKAIPGATIRYCILVQNAGQATATSVVSTDNLPPNVTYVPGSMVSGTNCSTGLMAEDDDAIGPNEVDPFGMNVSGITINGTAATLAPGASFAMVFDAVLN